MIGSVRVNGLTLDPQLVEAEAITATHGRRSHSAGPTASTAALVLLSGPGTPAPARSGDVLEILHTTGAPLFTGRVTDRSIAHNPDDPRAAYTITAMGTVARLGSRPLGDAPWPQETGAARATRILELAGTPFTVDGPDPAVIRARDIDATTALDALTSLAASTAAAVVDLPDGRVLYQPLAGRANPVSAFMWSDFDPALTWDQIDALTTWDGLPPSIGQWPSPSTPPPLTLPPYAIEYEPTWASAEAWITNHSRVGYGVAPEGGERPFTELTDADSITAHGRRYVFTATELATLADAAAYASRIITTTSRERWQLSDVTVILPALTSAAYAAALELRCGKHITVTGLPQPAPALDWTGIVEGWTYSMWTTYSGRAESLTLALSDPLHSLAVIKWADYPSLYKWQDHPAYLTWDDLNDLDALEAA